ncbi:MAG: hypothetical protein J6Y43_06810, partial [Clostridia bacterium]|nr:hypothetical protein [Clostridia bacterium]
MKHFLALAKVQYFELVNPGKSKLKKAKGPVFLLLIGALVAYIGYIYSETFYDLLMRIGEQPVTIIPMMVGVAFFGTILYSFYTTGNSLYSTKDYDMLSAMP